LLVIHILSAKMLPKCCQNKLEKVTRRRRPQMGGAAVQELTPATINGRRRRVGVKHASDH
jgi:hypothetical protein